MVHTVHWSTQSHISKVHLVEIRTPVSRTLCGRIVMHGHYDREEWDRETGCQSCRYKFRSWHGNLAPVKGGGS